MTDDPPSAKKSAEGGILFSAGPFKRKQMLGARALLTMYLMMLETDGDRERFLRLHGAYEKKLYAVALRLLGDDSRAEDAVQQTWMRVIEHWERVSALPWEETEGYVVTIAKNAALDMVRAQRRITALPEDWDMPAPDPGETEYRRLVALVRTMPEGYRRVLELKFVEERTNREIARMLGMNESTVSTRVKRGRAMLAEVMEREGYRCG